MTRGLSLSPGVLIGYYLFFIILIMIPVVVANVLILIVLIVDRTTSVIVRLMMSNIPVACLVVSAGVLLYDFVGLGLAYTDIGVPDNVIELCRTVLFLIGSGGVARLLFMAAFSVTVYLIVRFNILNKSNKWTIVYFVVVVAVLWVFVFVARIPLFFDAVISNSCRYTIIGGAINVSIYVILFGVGGFTVTAIFFFLTLCYIRTNTISEQGTFKKAILKLSAFLLIGNIINFIGQVVPPIIGILITTENGMTSLAGEIAYYLAAILIDLSLIPTPILLIVYFKPVRVHLKRWFCCMCIKEKMQYSGKSGETYTASLSYRRRDTAS